MPTDGSTGATYWYLFFITVGPTNAFTALTLVGWVAGRAFSL